MVTPIRDDAVLTGKALTNIQNIVRYCERLAAYYGETHEDTVRAYRSFARSLFQALDAESLWGEDDLNLGGKMPYGIYFGVIGHPVRNMCKHSGCSHYLREDGTVGYYSRTSDHDGDHDWSRPIGSPDPITWSLHS